MQAIVLAVCGLAGVGSRFIVDILVQRAGVAAYFGTLSINVAGAFIAGLLYGLGTERGVLSPLVTTSLLVGFCGGFTTFSAYSLQAVTLAEKGNVSTAIGYLLVSPILGFLAAYLGLVAARSFSGV